MSNAKGKAEQLTYDVADVAAKLGMSERHIYGALQRGELPGFRVGHRWAIPKAAIDKLLNVEAKAAC